MIVLYLLIGLILFYILYLIFKEPSRDDLFFLMRNLQSQEKLLKTIDSLEIQNKSDYSYIRAKIRSFFADNRLSQGEIILIEEYLLNTYFEGFKSRFIAFKKADIYLKLIYVLSLIWSFVLFNIIIFEMTESKDFNEEKLWLHIGISVVFFVVPLLFWLVQLGLFSVVMLVISSMLPQIGSLNRAHLTLDELIKLIKPFGRNTPVKLGWPNQGQWPRFK